MNTQRNDFLRLMGMPPARLNVEETAWYLGFMDHDIPVLVRAGLLKPLVRSPQAVKYFATFTLAKLREDERWLARASEAIIKHWRTKNSRISQETDMHSASYAPVNRRRNLAMTHTE
jgi:hypothetical protein